MSLASSPSASKIIFSVNSRTCRSSLPVLPCPYISLRPLPAVSNSFIFASSLDLPKPEGLIFAMAFRTCSAIIAKTLSPSCCEIIYKGRDWHTSSLKTDAEDETPAYRKPIYSFDIGESKSFFRQINKPARQIKENRCPPAGRNHPSHPGHPARRPHPVLQTYQGLWFLSRLARVFLPAVFLRPTAAR